MKQTKQSMEYDRLYEKYNKMSNEELSEIIKPDNGYTEIAIQVASDILQSDRSKYYKNVKLEQQKTEDKQKIDYNNILVGLSQDIHSIKIMLLFFVILTIIGILSAFYMVYVEVPKLF